MRKALLWVALGAWLAVTAYPLAWMVYTGLKTDREVRQNVWSLPAHPRWSNLPAAVAQGGLVRAYANSAVVAVGAGLLAVAAAAPAAYALSRLRFRGREVVFYGFLLGMMVPVHVTLIPLTRLLSVLQIRGTHLALIGPYAAFALPVSIFVLRGFFDQVPRELEDAARIDGCGSWGVFVHVALPAARPALATVVVLNFVTMWNELVFAMTFVNRPDLQTLPVALLRFRDLGGVMIPEVCAALTAGVVPMLLVYFVAQRHVVRGLTAGALKQ
jgi:raffinose/stachyose/melibiose transport system permease protein